MTDTFKGRVMVDMEIPVPPIPRYLVMALRQYGGKPYWDEDSQYEDLDEARNYVEREREDPPRGTYRWAIVEVGRE